MTTLIIMIMIMKLPLCDVCGFLLVDHDHETPPCDIHRFLIVGHCLDHDHHGHHDHGHETSDVTAS